MSQQDSNQPDDHTSSSTDNAKPKLVFAPGCFDNFEGTQEELEELIKEIQRMFDSGEVFEKAVPIDDDELDEIMEGKNHGQVRQ